jgi:hypothetical protein
MDTRKSRWKFFSAFEISVNIAGSVIKERRRFEPGAPDAGHGASSQDQESAWS